MTAGKALSRLSAVPGAPRLICLHHAGGNAGFFGRWGRELAGQCEVWTANLPGRRERSAEPAITDADTLVTQLAEAAADLLDRPVAIFGHSMGGLLGFEIARRLLSDQEAPVAALVVSACKAPHVHLGNDQASRTEAGLVDILRSWGGTPAELLDDQEFLDLVLPSLRADLVLCDAYRYQPGPPLPTPITAIAAIEDHVAPERDVAAWAVHSERWRGLRLVAGDHFYLAAARDLALDVVTTAVRDGVHALKQDA
jgi:surfactin synthase thioesterase subunit